MAEFKIKPLSALMGAEITGVDLRGHIQKEVKEKLLKACSFQSKFIPLMSPFKS